MTDDTFPWMTDVDAKIAAEERAAEVRRTRAVLEAEFAAGPERRKRLEHDEAERWRAYLAEQRLLRAIAAVEDVEVKVAARERELADRRHLLTAARALSYTEADPLELRYARDRAVREHAAATAWLEKTLAALNVQLSSAKAELKSAKAEKETK